MSLVWKLLRRHISPLQLGGFFAANLLGMLILLLGLQFYVDVRPLLSGQDGVLKSDYLIVSKHVSAAAALGSGEGQFFTAQEMDDIRRQPFCRSVGAFTASLYTVQCRMGISGVASFGTDMFFESVPDQYVDAHLSKWSFDAAHPQVPIVLPRSYLAIYNFGFAQSQQLPKISEGVAGMIDLQVTLSGNGLREQYPARVVGFSSRLNTILVPQDFIRWSNERFAPNSDNKPTRLIVEVGNPGDENITKYLEDNGYEVETDKLDAEKTTYFLRMIVLMVMVIGLVISVLSFYILMLSIYLLVQKNSSKLENLLLIGYSPGNVAMPYLWLTIVLNVVVLLVAWCILFFIRDYYMDFIEALYPDIEEGTMCPAIALGLVLFLIVSVLNMIAIRRKVMRIWLRKD